MPDSLIIMSNPQVGHFLPKTNFSFIEKVEKMGHGS